MTTIPTGARSGIQGCPAVTAESIRLTDWLTTLFTDLRKPTGHVRGVFGRQLGRSRPNTANADRLLVREEEHKYGPNDRTYTGDSQHSNPVKRRRGTHSNS